MLQGPLILLLLLMLAVAAPALAAEPDPADDSGTINIMRPEPGTAPAKHQKRSKNRKSDQALDKLPRAHVRGSSNPVYPTPLPRPQAPVTVPRIEAAPRHPVTPPPLYVPQTGRTLPNLPATGAGPGGAETSQDKAVRCAHQAGVYGPNATGNPNTYIGGCINQ